MADNVDVTPGTGKTIRTDEANSAQYQVIKIGWGADGSATHVNNTAGTALPVADVNAASVSGADGATMPAEVVLLGADNDGGGNVDELYTDNANSLRVRSGPNVVNIAGTLTRAATGTQYGVGDMMANTEVASTCVPISFVGVSRNSDDAFIIKRARLNKDDDDVTAAEFRLHLFLTDPFAVDPTSVDNTAISLNVTAANLDNYLGAYDFDMTTSPDLFTTGNTAIGTPVDGSWTEIASVTEGTSTTIYGVLEARGTYTPVSGEVFEAILEVVQG